MEGWICRIYFSLQSTKNVKRTNPKYLPPAAPKTSFAPFTKKKEGNGEPGEF